MTAIVRPRSADDFVSRHNRYRKSRKVLTVTGAISTRTEYLLRKNKTPRRKPPAPTPAKAELFSARLWAIAKNLRRGFRNVAPYDHTLPSFVTRLRERPQHCSRKSAITGDEMESVDRERRRIGLFVDGED